MDVVRFTSGNDTLVIGSDASFLGLEGDDTYVLEASVIPANAEIVITDNDGDNVVRLPDGVEIVESQIATLGNGSNAIRLTLSNDTTVLIDGAGGFTFEVGGSFGGFEAVTQDFESFVTDTLGATVPAPGDQSAGGAVSIGAPTPSVRDAAEEADPLPLPAMAGDPLPEAAALPAPEPQGPAEIEFLGGVGEVDLF